MESQEQPKQSIIKEILKVLGICLITYLVTISIIFVTDSQTANYFYNCQPLVKEHVVKTFLYDKIKIHYDQVGCHNEK